MGFFDKAKRMMAKGKDKAEDLADDHGEQIVKGIDKATDAIDGKTKGKYADQLDKVDDAAASGVDKLRKTER
jgi:hypothetical protein